MIEIREYMFTLYTPLNLCSAVYYFRSSAGTSPNEGYLSSSYGSVPQALPTFQHPSHALLKENGFTQQVYHKYHSRCLKGIINQYTVLLS